jgi:hypothetical protein
MNGGEGTDDADIPLGDDKDTTGSFSNPVLFSVVVHSPISVNSWETSI